ncbi:MAG: prepilin-type N-terminal cleavage/methylation domain-containing protein, partial [Candidatus Omnitrophica bacterium]|nr:prepilin-type N-terminal cleavage/methylation domain-containing protein [Candidatus Omnitrophota bacterium]
MRSLKEDKMKKGFTLIELIIVVIVIGVLATLAVPQYLKAVERSQIG